MRKFFTLFILFCAFFFIALGLWLERKFGIISFEQIIYHLQFGGEGLVDADVEITSSFFRSVLIPSFITLGLYTAIYHFLSKKITARPLKTLNTLTFIGFIAFGSFFILSKISFWDYLLNNQTEKYKAYENFIDKNYIAPKIVSAPQKKKNLILIYMESMENTYSDKKLFTTDLLKPLNDKTKDWQSFNNYVQTTGTNWTIAAVISTQCGVPLRPWHSLGTKVERNKFGEYYNNFMPGIVCLGDILKAAGYKNIYMGGASLNFAGKGKFLRTHGYDEAWGREEWLSAGHPETNMNTWGLFDDQLFKNAKLKLDELAKSDQPFNLTLLTVDSHQPNGHYSPSCRQQGAKAFTDIIECTAGLAADFIQYAEEKGYTKNTDIVVMGDHLAMANPVDRTLQSASKRTIYNRFYSQTPLTKNTENLYHFSVFPTILTMLDFTFEGEKLGLGVSGFGDLKAAPPSLYAEADIDRKLAAPTTIYTKFWTPLTEQGFSLKLRQ